LLALYGCGMVERWLRMLPFSQPPATAYRTGAFFAWRGRWFMPATPCHRCLPATTTWLAEPVPGAGCCLYAGSAWAGLALAVQDNMHVLPYGWFFCLHPGVYAQGGWFVSILKRWRLASGYLDFLRSAFYPT